MTWPAMRHPASTVPQDLGDPLYFAWQIAWTGQHLGYTTNAFQQAHGNLAYTDAVLGYAPFAAVVTRVVPGPAGALLTLNLLSVLTAALAFAGAYLLARVLGARVPGALVMAAAYAYAPWHLAHARHINVLSTGGVVLALAFLSYGHGWSLRHREQPALRRPPWVLAGWLVAAWQLTLGFALGVPFAWVLALVVLGAYLAWRAHGRPVASRRADVLGVGLFVLTGVLLAIPYLRVVLDFPAARRTPEMVALYSPPAHGLLTPPPESLLWGSLIPSDLGPEQTLLPGFVLLLLAAAGLYYSAWTVRHRLVLAAAALTSAVLALGTSAPFGGRWTYLLVFERVPGFEAVRTPGRLILWTTLALGLLAAGAVTRLSDHDWGRRELSPGLVVPALLVPALLVTVEGLGRVPHPVVPPAPVALSTVAAPVLFLPTSQPADHLPMTWSTDGWPDLLNGGSGYETPRQSHLRDIARSFPQPWTVAKLRSRGVKTVVLTRSLAPGTPWATLATQPAAVLTAQAAAVGLTAEVRPEAVIYRFG